LSDEIEKNKKILDAYHKRVGLNLKRIPQGPGSGLDSDTVDGLHVQQVIAKAQRTFSRPRSGGFYLPHLGTDPATGGLKESFLWYDPTTHKYKFFDGTSIQAIPGATGGGGSAAKGDYSYIIYKSGSDCYAEDNEGNVDYGGSGDAGGVDGADAHAVIDTAIGAIDGTTNNLGGRIVLVNNTFPLSTNALTVTFDTSSPKKIELVGVGEVVLTGSGTKMFDVTNSVFILNETFRLYMENLKFEHDCSNATDITLDMVASNPSLNNVWCRNGNGTIQGTAFKVGRGSAIAPSGYPCTWISPVASRYGTAFELGLDHAVYINPIANSPKNKGFWLHDTFDDTTYNPMYMTFLFPHLYVIGQHTTIYPFVTTNAGQAINIWCPFIEGVAGSPLTHEMFYKDGAGGSHVMVWGMTAQPANNPISNSSS